jgi:ABC-2 type transport system permease protein
MTPQASLAIALERTPPPMGSFKLGVLRLEVRRLLRNRRTMVIAIAMPVTFFLGFGRNSTYVHQSSGHGNVTAFAMISIALFGAVLATANGGAMVAGERALGWSRQLRLTPLSPAAYIAIKMLTSLTLAAGAVGAVYLIGLATNQASMPSDLWVITGVCVWAGSLLFSAFGLFLGYSLPPENVTQVLSLILILCAFSGGLFIPVSHFPHLYATLAEFTPLYGLNELVHYPLAGGAFTWLWVLNLGAWLGLFVLGAVGRFRRDTARA